MSVTMTVEGAAGKAARLDLTRRAQSRITDYWVLTLDLPRWIYGPAGGMLAHQYAIVVAGLDVIAADGQYMQEHPNATHALALAPLVDNVAPEWTGAGWPEIGELTLSQVEFEAGNDAQAREVARAVAGSAARGDLPIGARFSRAVWSYGVRVAASALDQARRDYLRKVG